MTPPISLEQPHELLPKDLQTSFQGPFLPQSVAILTTLRGCCTVIDDRQFLPPRTILWAEGFTGYKVGDCLPGGPTRCPSCQWRFAMSKVIYIIALVLFVPGLVFFIADSGTIVLPLSALLGLTGAVISLFENDTDAIRKKAVTVVLCGVTLAGVFFFLEFPKIAFALALLSTIGIELVMIVSLMRRRQSKLLDRIVRTLRCDPSLAPMESLQGKALKTPELRTAGMPTEDATKTPAKPDIDADQQEALQDSTIDHSSDHDAEKLVTRLYPVATRKQTQIALHVWKALDRERDRVFHGSEPGQLVIHGSMESHRRAATLLKLLAAGKSPENISWPTGPFTESESTAQQSSAAGIGHSLGSSTWTLLMTLLGAILAIPIGLALLGNMDVGSSRSSSNDLVALFDAFGRDLAMEILGPFIAAIVAIVTIAAIITAAVVGGGAGMCFGLATRPYNRTPSTLTNVSPPDISDPKLANVPPPDDMPG